MAREHSTPASADGAVQPLSSELLGAILEHVGLPMFVKDRQFRYVLVNPALSAYVHRAPSDLLGRTDYDFLPTAQADQYRAVDTQVFERGEAVVIEEDPFLGDDGHLHVLRTVKEPVRDPRTGEITHLVGVFTDLTGAKRAEESLRGANEELERRVRERTRELENAQQQLIRNERLGVLGQLAASVAHQVRNPLAAIATASAILRRKLAKSDDPEVAQALTAILEEVWDANRIITELLDYARVKTPLLAVVDLAELVEETIASTSPPDAVRVERDIEPDLAVTVDPRQARDALASVIRNAYEAMPSGGRLLVSACRDGDDAFLAIEDTGPGLTRDAIKGLFEPLVTSKPLGLGLGLATARLLLENQRGSIRAATQRGGGARFEIRLPLHRAERAPR